MPKTIDDFFDEIDEARSFRVRELSEIKRLFGRRSVSSDPMGVQSKALVVLSYATWEGFYNECVEAYCDFLQLQGKQVSATGWKMIIGVLSAEFESLRGRHHSQAAKGDFINNLKSHLSSDFTKFDRGVVRARSNLDWRQLEYNFEVLGFNLDPIQPHRNRLDKELVSWRHGVAHGNAPNLGSLDAADHINLVADVMMLVSDAFQSAMVKHI